MNNVFSMCLPFGFSKVGNTFYDNMKKRVIWLGDRCHHLSLRWLHQVDIPNVPTTRPNTKSYGWPL